MGQERSSSKDERRLYRDLVWVWPIMRPPEDYVEEGKKLSELIKGRSPEGAETLLHLGCGGGHNDYTLKDHFKVTGIDISGAMLELACRLNPEVDYHQGDMRSVRLDKAFDAVVGLDSLAYMLSQDELRKVFETAYIHLKPGGVFGVLPEFTRESFRQNWTHSSSHSSGDVSITYLENYYDPDPSGTIIEATFVYLIRQGGKLEIETDHHLCGIFGMEAWENLLTETGFEVELTQLMLKNDSGEEEEYPLLVCLKALEA
jgi:SAM-dependent methyltransferase